MRFVCLLVLFLLSEASWAQYVSVMDYDSTLSDACLPFNIYGLYNGRAGQKQAIPPITLDSIRNQIQRTSKFVQNNPKYKGSVAVQCIINCKGELIRCQSYGRWGEPELRLEVLAVFKTLEQWTPGELYGDIVDCVEDFRVWIDRGVITVESNNIY